MILETIKHLLPRATAWRVTIDKALRRFLLGLTLAFDEARKFIDTVWRQIDPQTTDQLDEWEAQFGLPPTVTVEQDRRDRLSGAWQALGGQSPRYIQDTLQAAGFDVYVHEWWVPASSPPVARNPHTYLSGAALYNAQCGGAEMQCGDVEAQCGDLFSAGGYYPLVNKIGDETPTYVLPGDPAKWPFFVYIGGQTFPAPADVPAARREELEALVLKLCPTQLWVGMLINYV